MNGDKLRSVCLKSACGWNAKGEVICDSGDGSCATAKVLIGENCEFHDDVLISASLQIQGILDTIPTDSNGRELAFLNTTTGVLLAWVHHGKEVPEDSVTIEDDYEVIAKALGLCTEEPAYQSKGS